MPGNNWLGAERNEVAAERILDAAGELFAQRPAATIGMLEIARAAGCSRATLYRYFENRQALDAAFVDRESSAMQQQMIERLSGIDDPRERLVTGFVSVLELVRRSPALQSWFSSADAPIGVEVADGSDVVLTIVTGFVISLGIPDDRAAIERKARWLLRALTSFLLFPGRDTAEEKAMVEDFLVPILIPARQNF